MAQAVTAASLLKPVLRWCLQTVRGSQATGEIKEKIRGKTRVVGSKTWN